jgi:hypothetical protein
MNSPPAQPELMNAAKNEMIRAAFKLPRKRKMPAITAKILKLEE